MKHRARKLSPTDRGPIMARLFERSKLALGDIGEDGVPLVIPWEVEAVEAAQRLAPLVADGRKPTAREIHEHAEDVGTLVRAAWAHPDVELEGETGAEVLEDLRRCFGGLAYHLIMMVLQLIVNLITPFGDPVARARELGNPDGPSGEPS